MKKCLFLILAVFFILGSKIPYTYAQGPGTPCTSDSQCNVGAGYYCLPDVGGGSTCRQTAVPPDPAGPVNIGGYAVSPPTGLRSEFVGQGALANIISRLYIFTLPIIGIIAFLFFLWAGYQYLSSKGDPKALDGAKSRLTYTIIGLIIIFLAYAITGLVLTSFGIRMI